MAARLLAAVSLAFSSNARADGPPTPEEERAAIRLADPSLTIELGRGESAAPRQQPDLGP